MEDLGGTAAGGPTMDPAMSGPQFSVDSGGHVWPTQSYGVLCAWCGCDGVQLAGRPELNQSGDDYSPNNPSRQRGDWITQHIRCEQCLGSSVIVTSFHKGAVSVGVWPTGHPQEGSTP